MSAPVNGRRAGSGLDHRRLCRRSRCWGRGHRGRNLRRRGRWARDRRRAPRVARGVGKGCRRGDCGHAQRGQRQAQSQTEKFAFHSLFNPSPRSSCAAASICTGQRLPPHSVTGIYSPVPQHRRKVPAPADLHLHLALAVSCSTSSTLRGTPVPTPLRERPTTDCHGSASTQTLRRVNIRSTGRGRSRPNALVAGSRGLREPSRPGRGPGAASQAAAVTTRR